MNVSSITFDFQQEIRLLIELISTNNFGFLHRTKAARQKHAGEKGEKCSLHVPSIASLFNSDSGAVREVPPAKSAPQISWAMRKLSGISV